MSDYSGARFDPAAAVDLPSISIVTICKNASATISRTLESVARCDYPRLEYVVVDGGSTDGTVALIRRHRVRIDKFICEADAGISDALNKGVRASAGDYHLVVHADDTMVPEALSVLAQCARTRQSSVVSGSVLVVGARGPVRRFKPQPRLLTRKMSIPHMGSIIKKDAWAAVGGYDLRKSIAMDHLLMLKILKRFGPDAFSVVDTIVAEYCLGGVSDRQVDLGFRELRDNLTEEGGCALAAATAYAALMIKSRIARLIGRG